MKKCTGCKEYVSYSKFYKNKHTKDGYQNECNECRKLRQRREAQKRKEKYGTTANKQQCFLKYGITLEEYRDRMSTSDRCGVCGTKEGLCYDHDHNTMKFRGVLCGSCNTGFGKIGDTLESSRALYEYALKHYGPQGG